MPFWALVPSWIAGAPSLRRNVVAVPLTAAGPAVAVGLAPVDPEPPQAAPVPLMAPVLETCTHCVPPPARKARVAAVVALRLSIVGAEPNTALPVPVLVVSAASRLALDGVPRNVATPVPRP